MVNNNNNTTTMTHDDKHQASSVLSIQNLLSPVVDEEKTPATTTTRTATRRSRAKTKRKRASPSQLAVLNQVFNQTYFPSTELRAELGKQLGMNPRTVQIWFQNKRQALRARDRACRKHLTPLSPPLSPHAISLPPLRLTLASSSSSPPSPLTCSSYHHSPTCTLPSPSSMDLNPFHY